MGKILLAFGYHDREAPRHWNGRRDLEQEGWEVRECHTNKNGLFAKYADLRKQFHIQKEGVSTVLVTFPGHYLMPLAWFLCHFSSPILWGRDIPAPQKIKLIFDAFISLSDSIVSDRHKVTWLNPYAWFLYLMDIFTCALADEIWIDTEAHRRFFIRRFFLNPKKIRTVYLKPRSDIFSPRTHAPRPLGKPIDVLFYGTYIPLQGIEHILHAAKLLQKSAPHVHFTLVGSGQTYRSMRALADKLQLTHVAFHERIPFTELPDRIRKADLCLGIFAKGGKASRVIPHKVYDAISCGVPVLTADTPAIHEQFEDGKEVILCTAGDPEDIALKIEEFAQNINVHISE